MSDSATIYGGAGMPATHTPRLFAAVNESDEAPAVDFNPQTVIAQAVTSEDTTAFDNALINQAPAGPDTSGAPSAAVGGETTAETANAEAGLIPATTANLDAMTVDELKAYEAAAHAALEAKQAAAKAQVVEQVVAVVKEYGITTQELVDALGGLKIKRQGVPAKAKYRDPATGATWSGRGKDPVWIRDKDRTQFLITE